MKLIKNEILISKGTFPESHEFSQILDEVKNSITKVVWPEFSHDFTINPVKKMNGVKPIKNNCMLHLAENNWILEQRMSLGTRISPGPVDAVKRLNDGRFFAVEWETGNISSSHRAINKMAIGILENVLAGGILILPSRDLYNYVTDRIGNYAEIEPYFSIWKKLGILDPSITNAYLSVIEIEYDNTSHDVPFIPKGTDGRALV